MCGVCLGSFRFRPDRYRAAIESAEINTILLPVISEANRVSVRLIRFDFDIGKYSHEELVREACRKFVNRDVCAAHISLASRAYIPQLRNAIASAARRPDSLRNPVHLVSRRTSLFSAGLNC